jgi:alpha-methylacyl-CoA racemase
MLLADFGADVLRVDRPGQANLDVLCRRKRSIQLDLKMSSSKKVLDRLLLHADVLIDPFRPGVLEDLGFEPERLRKRNKRLIIARLTGFQSDSTLIDFKANNRQIQEYGGWVSGYHTYKRTRYQLPRGRGCIVCMSCL